MTALTGAIVTHNLKEIEKIISEAPSLALEKENGWLPIEWAEKTGNVVTFTRTARLLSCALERAIARKSLASYFSIVTSTEYEPLSKDEAAVMVWATVFEGASFKIDRWQRPLINSQEQIQDIQYLLHQSGASSSQQLAELVKNA